MRKTPIARLLAWEASSKTTPPPIEDGEDVCRSIPHEGYPVIDQAVKGTDGKFAGWERVNLRWVKPQ